ncbi:MAG: hypothetical protein ACK46X_15615, partial [Candidatus Sericytochromatia bacterium]
MSWANPELLALLVLLPALVIAIVATRRLRREPLEDVDDALRRAGVARREDGDVVQQLRRDAARREELVRRLCRLCRLCRGVCLEAAAAVETVAQEAQRVLVALAHLVGLVIARMEDHRDVLGDHLLGQGIDAPVAKLHVKDGQIGFVLLERQRRGRYAIER